MNLDNVTLVTVACQPETVNSHKAALRHCESMCNFKKTLLISCADDKEFDNVNVGCLDKGMYSQFCVEMLNDYIDTEFCLLVQWDGFIINKDMWTEDFLNYDYVGAPWPFFGNMIGNGGFSLRSKKFLSISSKINYTTNFPPGTPAISGLSICPEDWFLCQAHRKTFEENNVSFPSFELARQFSIEHPTEVDKDFDKDIISTYKSFGFHGDWNSAAMKEVHNEY